MFNRLQVVLIRYSFGALATMHQVMAIVTTAGASSKDAFSH